MVFGGILRVGLVLLALTVTVFAANAASAHDAARAVLAIDGADAGDKAKASPLVYCHHGPLCNGVVGLDSFHPAVQVRSRVVKSARLHSLPQPYDPPGFDPPPPRFLS